MNEDLNFKAYLFISLKKISISINDARNFNQIYYSDFLIQDNPKILNYSSLNKFLSENIFKIEKKINKFIKSICVIIDYKNFFSLNISIKKNSYENTIDKKVLTHLLNEAKNQCKKSLIDNQIIHIVINNYKIDGKDFLQLPENLKCKNFSIDVKFICFSSEKIKELENILKEYQISINQIVSANYVKDYFKDINKNIFELSDQIVEGCNKNEVKIVNKTPLNKGFFEKFFNFFS